ncbi:MAG TPA: tRNA (adenosine(37)-N6)-threonylcarbamoyltransferase complex ATPase subunit type 1 TsaE [Trebonia sp.]|nr:tRNA (adenosine(37)-N6)-threonylcarbamoyltransferase complex ATPase subunit type 1 TsaE [Trebonia sp.]
MRALGRALAAAARPGDLLILAGGLGAGKTTLVQGLGDGLGVRGPITSPTFVIARVHPPAATARTEHGLAGPRPALVHVDAYRLGSALELDDLDLDTDLAASVTVVEWGEGMAEDLSADRLEIAIAADGAAAAEPDHLTADTPRTVRIRPVGERWEGLKLPLADLPDRL